MVDSIADLDPVPETREPKSGGKRGFTITELSVTQYVSFLLYITLFSATLAKYKLEEKGFGCVDKSIVTPGNARKWTFAILWLICFGSATRIYLSFWNVEGSLDFQSLRKKWHPLVRFLDWFGCRSACFLCVNLLPIAVAASEKCGWIEGLLIASYLIMLVWDVWIGIALCRKASERWCCFLNVKEIIGNCFRENFKYKVGLWTYLELFGFLMSVAYFLVVRGGDAENITFALGSLSVVTVVIIFLDIFLFNIKDYLSTLVWCLLGIWPVIWLVQTLG